MAYLDLRLYACWSTQSRLATLLSGGLDFRLPDGSDLKDLSVDGLGLMLLLLSGPLGFTCWISFAPVFSFTDC